MKKILLVLLLVLVLVPTGCMKAVTPAQLSKAQSDLNASIVSLSSKVDALGGRISSLEGRPTVSKADLDALSRDLAALRTDIAKLQTTVTALQTTVTALDTRITKLETAATTTTTLTGLARWDLTAYCTFGSSPEPTFSWTVAPTPVKEDGDYLITLYFANDTNDDMTSVKVSNITIVLTPRTAVKVSDDTEIYSYTAPLNWSTDIMVKADDTCKRIEGKSNVVLTIPTIVAGGRYSLQVIFSLVYK